MRTRRTGDTVNGGRIEAYLSAFSGALEPSKADKRSRIAVYGSEIRTAEKPKGERVEVFEVSPKPGVLKSRIMEFSLPSAGPELGLGSRHSGRLPRSGSGSK